MKRKISPERRAQIGQEKRARTRADILKVATILIGREKGRSTRIDDICAHAHVSRGSFYNYFSSMDELFDALGYEMSHDLNVAVRAVLSTMRPGAERTCAAIRYYLYRTRKDPAWAWATVHSAGPLFGADTFRQASISIREGIENGDFNLPNATVGLDLLLGTVMAAMITLLGSEAPPDHPEVIARQILVGLGVKKATIDRCINAPLPEPFEGLAKPRASHPAMRDPRIRHQKEAAS